MNIFKKINSPDAQHSVEYTILLILIMAGIIIAGPYVVRSWNANLKGWDDSIQDSFQDPLLSVPPDDAPLEGCEPNIRLDMGCNTGVLDPCTGKTINCGPREWGYLQTYVPDGCQCRVGVGSSASVQCVLDNRCCEYVDDGCGANATPPCPDGQHGYNRFCGPETTPTHVCGYLNPPPYDNFAPGIIDPVCVFACQIPPSKITAPSTGYGSLCASDEIGLPSNLPYSYVNSGACTDPIKCEIQCAVGYLPFIGGLPVADHGTSCNDCPVGFENTLNLGPVCTPCP